MIYEPTFEEWNEFNRNNQLQNTAGAQGYCVCSPYHCDKNAPISSCRKFVHDEMKRVTKMTRQEAIDKFKTASGAQYGSPIVDGLEALGLIKFEKKEYGNSPIDLIGRTAVSLLEANGYTIIRSKL